MIFKIAVKMNPANILTSKYARSNVQLFFILKNK